MRGRTQGAATFRVIAAALALGAAAAGCGQKGPLYLPDQHRVQVVARGAQHSSGSASSGSRSAATPQTATPPPP
ncbi:MAG TPA: lipoprotein [Steroidobacteraceae bacterium]|nr:lipoprotein [Steroidobacteraceae bacterium]